MDYYCAFFIYIMLWLHILYIIIYLYDQNWQLPSLKDLSPQLLFFSILFSFLVAKDGHG